MILKEKSNEAKINGEFLRKLDWVVNKNVWVEENLYIDFTYEYVL